MKTRKRSRKADVVLSVIVLLLAAFGIFVGWEQLQNRRDVSQFAVEQASSYPMFQRNIGMPVRIGWFVSGKTTGFFAWPSRCCDFGTADLLIPIRGPNGRGDLSVWMQYGMAGRHICSMNLITSSGMNIVIKPDEQSHCERE